MATTLARTDAGALVTVDGEIAHDPAAYLASLGDGSLKYQHQLAAAYDKAVASLIGPNDVQVENGRKFKKKSAWRKLARHFRISTEVVKQQTELHTDEVFLASVTVRAVAPWGQFAEAVGACGTDEAVGRRVITRADALATAETRATNRAVSNLIAMGEVSAEEMAKGQPRQNTGSRSTRQGGDPGAFLMPFGKSKGKKIGQMETDDLEGALNWARDKGKFEEFQAAAFAELERRVAPVKAEVGLDEVPPALEGGDDLPF